MTLTNFARNSPATISNLEYASLELQRFLCLLKDLVIELRATFQGLSPMQASGPRPQETATGLVLRAAGLGSLALSGSGERNTAPAWCSSSWHDASLKQKPPTRAQNRRKVVSLSVPGRIIFHGAPEQLTRGRIFFHPGPVCGHRIHQQSSDWGAGRSAAVCRASPADEGRCHVGGVEVDGRMSGLKGDRVCKRNPHARLVRYACVNKFALHAKKCPNWAFYGVLGEFCTGCGVGGGVLGEFCTGCAVVDR